MFWYAESMVIRGTWFHFERKNVRAADSPSFIAMFGVLFVLNCFHCASTVLVVFGAAAMYLSSYYSIALSRIFLFDFFFSP